jgi:creatinine amidohydrolase
MQLGDLKWTQTESIATKPVVVPLGALEQHGHHMPMFTDSMIIGEIARRAEAELGNEAVFLPTLWIGSSDHHLGFPGTVSAGSDTYVQLLEDIIESLLSAGFRRIFLLNGHGGNIVPGRQAIYNVQLRQREIEDIFLCFSSWWTITAPQLEAMPDLEAKTVNHACELETSMILTLRPELVDMTKATGMRTTFPSEFYVPDFSAPSRVDVARAFDQLSATGAFGHPEIATAEKGEALFAACAEQVALFVRELANWPVVDPA